MKKHTLYLLAASALTLGAVIAAPTLDRATPIEGRPFVIDGDTIQLRGEHIRLSGIDAPELNQLCERGTEGFKWKCGTVARESLRYLVENKFIACYSSGRDPYHRLLATCYVGTNEVNRTMVRIGMAVAYRHFSTRYVADELLARTDRVGIWSGTFTDPYLYRKEHRK